MTRGGDGDLRPAGRDSYAWVVLAMGSLAVFGALGLARFGYSMVLPSMQSGLGLTNTDMGLVATANLAGYVALSAIAGALASHSGSRVVVTMGLVGAALGMAGTGLAGGLTALVAWRALTGVASGCINVPTVSLMPAWFPSHRRGFATGIVTVGQSLGLVVAGVAVPRLLNTFGPQGWRACWYLFAVIALVLAAGTYLFLGNRPGDRPYKRLSRSRSGAPEAGARPVAPAEKLSYRSVYRSARIWHLGFVYVAFGFSYIIFMTFFTKRLVADVHYTAGAAGNLFMLMGWCSMVSGVLWGSVSDRLGRKWTLAIVYSAHAVAFGLFALWPVAAGLTLSAVIFGLTAWSVPAIVAAACSDILGPRLSAAGLGFVTIFFGLGQAVGPSVAGALADATGSFRAAFLVASGAALLGVVGSLLLRSERTKDGARSV
jgi:MFS family permease